MDSDGDGLLDSVETSGWLTQRGTTYRTDPTKMDTDGDGLSDGEEAGALTASDPAPTHNHHPRNPTPGTPKKTKQTMLRDATGLVQRLNETSPRWEVVFPPERCVGLTGFEPATP